MKQAPVLTERDVKRVLQHCAQTAFPNRNRAVFQMGYLSGMRIGEIAALKISDVLAEERQGPCVSVPSCKQSWLHICGP